MPLDQSRTLSLRGKVFSGSGEGAKFIELPWVRRQITEKLGFTPYLGTLNIKMDKDSVKLDLLKVTKPVKILPDKGFCQGRCFSAYLMRTQKCAVVVPEVANYPEDVVEVIAPINLRKNLQLEDGDTIEVKIILQ